jgi:hypothetical protein
MRIRRVLAPVSLILTVMWGCAEHRATADSAVARSATATSDLDCGVSEGDVQIERGVGVLRIGAAVEAVRERCRIVRDTTALDNEGMPSRRIVVLLNGDTSVVEVVSDSIWRVRLTSPRFRTRGGLGVGTPARAFTALEGARALIGEGEIYVTVPAVCGVSYRMHGADFARVAGASSAEEALRELPDTARVDLLLLVECQERQEP